MSKLCLLVMIAAITCTKSAGTLTLPDLRSVFARTDCVEGVLASMAQGPTLITSTSIPQQLYLKSNMADEVNHYVAGSSETTKLQQQTIDHQQAATTNTSASVVPPKILANTNTKEQTPMCLINQLARHNNIQHQYLLIDEQGPAHQKTFTVRLELGREEYTAEGASIKQAQHSAAKMALQRTQFKHPLPKTGSGVLTPTVELNGLAMKRGERPMYVLENGIPDPQTQGSMAQPSYYPKHNIYGLGKPHYNYDTRSNKSTHSYLIPNENDDQEQVKYQHPPGEPFSIRLYVGVREYLGKGYNVQAARHDTAAKAIDDLKQNQIDDEQCPVNGDNAAFSQNDGCNDHKVQLKSPVSLVHEIALKRNLVVAFEVLSEKGPSHMKVFVSQCRVGDFVTEGEGNSKQKSKQSAAEKMLEELSKLEPVPKGTNLESLKPKRVAKKKKRHNLIKVITNGKLDYNKEMDPVSRLKQIKQSNEEKGVIPIVDELPNAPKRRKLANEASDDKDMSSKDRLLHLAQLLGFQVQFSEGPKYSHDLYFTLVSLGTTPPQVCLGEGPTVEKSHEKAALAAINFLSELGLDHVTSSKKVDLESSVEDSALPQVVPKPGLKQNGLEK